MTTLLLIHGGLWEDHMDAEGFWHRPGIVADLRRHGFDVRAPNRRRRAPDWTSEADHLASTLPDRPVVVVAGSNGCAVAARLVLALPDRIERLVLAWPATACDPAVDNRERQRLAGLGASPTVIDTLFAGQTLRGTTDNELATINAAIGVLPSIPENPSHQRRTVDSLLNVLPDAQELPGCPEPPRPDFSSHAHSFLSTVATFAVS